MGLFKNLFSQGKTVENEENTVPWINLTSLEQLKELERISATKPQAIFKHSTTCGISRMVLKMFTGNYTPVDGQMDLYYLDLLSYRTISNAIADKFHVLHQSPQILIIKNGSVVAHASHGAISDIDLEKYI